MQVECPNCGKKINTDAKEFLNQKYLKCFDCMYTIELRNSDGTLKPLNFSFEDEKTEKEESE
jgi:hypothetical protein